MSRYVRIGDIEWRQTSSIDGKLYEEIVKWEDNSYWNAEERMLKDGWIREEGGLRNDIFHVSDSMLNTKQVCYTLAMVEWSSSDEFDIKSIGLRAFELKGKDIDDFREVLNAVRACAMENDDV